MISKIKILFKTKNKKFRNRFARIGKHSIVMHNSQLVPENMYLDDYVVIQNNINFISFKGRLIVKKYSVISSGCIIIPASHKLKVGIPFYASTIKHIADENKDIIIEEDCWIGAGAILLPGIKIGRGCVVGAGAVVTKDIPPYAVVVGIPARIIATKFCIDDIKTHERKIYKKEERLEENVLFQLFQSTYKELPCIGNSFLSSQEEDMVRQLLDN